MKGILFYSLSWLNRNINIQNIQFNLLNQDKYFTFHIHSDPINEAPRKALSVITESEDRLGSVCSKHVCKTQ